MVINRVKCLAGALAVGAILVGCGGGGDSGAATSANNEASMRPAHYVLKWADEFSVDGALGAAWTYDLGAPLFGGSVWGNAELQYYTQDPKNVRTENGRLVIQAIASLPVTAPTDRGLIATSARVTTDTDAFYNALGNRPYGFYEIRAQIPCVAGAWPAVWMMGKDGNWPNRGELDIMEWFGRYFANDPNQVQSGVHTADNFGGNSLYGKLAVPGLCQGFHTYHVHWLPSAITVGVDGQTIFTYTKPALSTASNWPFDQPAHLLLNVAVGGNLGGDLGVHFELPDIPAMQMLVDYVRVWQPPS